MPPPTASGLASHASSPPASLTNPATAGLRKDLANFEISDSTTITSASFKAVSDPLEVTGPSNATTTASRAATQANSGNLMTPSLSASNVATLKTKPIQAVPTSEPVTPIHSEFPASIKGKLRPDSPGSQQPPPAINTAPPLSPVTETISDDDPFDVRETVNVLTLQFLSDHAETRIAALEWLLMLHLKAPTKILSRDSGTFPALLKTLSDPSEDVVKHDLQLLAQISASSEDYYFTSFMKNVLELFSTDRRLLETRGSLIIRQLCLHLNAERIYRTIAEILEKDDDLEFASMMVVKLNMILITSPELADFRRRLKNLESKDGQMLFSSLYRSWCHNPVAVFALCLLAQAYEHASNLLQIFAELELTVSLLVQIDKLVMLIESPVFTSLRLQLLEPDRYPFLPKCLYGLLMILPQSSAFISLRARLSVVQSAGYVPSTQNSRTSSATSNVVSATRSKLSGGNKDEIRWSELLVHFRSVQNRHEKARRQLNSSELGGAGSNSSVHYSSPSQTFNIAPPTGTLGANGQIPKSATMKKKSMSNGPRNSLGGSIGGPGSMSPLNPKRGGSTSSAGLSGVISPGVSIGGAVASMSGAQGLGSVRPISPPPGRKRMLGGMRRAV